MVFKTETYIVVLGVGFIIGFVSGYNYKCRRRLGKDLPYQGIIEKSEPEIEPEVEPEIEPEVGSIEATPPLNYITTCQDTYATLGELVQPKLETDRGGGGGLSLRQKYSLMEDYSYIVSIPYAQACRLVASKGYTLRVSSVQGNNQKLPTDDYSSTTFGVEIRDANYNFKTNTPSTDAVIVSINSVGPLGLGRIKN